MLAEAIRLLPALRTHGRFKPALVLADTCVALGHSDRARQVLAQLTRWLDDPMEEYHRRDFRWHLARHFYELGQFAEVVACLEPVVAAEIDAGYLGALDLFLEACLACNDRERVRHWLKRRARAIPAIYPPQFQVQPYCQLARWHLRIGERARAYDLLGRALAIVRDLRDCEMQCEGLARIADVWAEVGRRSRARRIICAMPDASERARSLLKLAEQADPAEAKALLVEVQTAARQIENPEKRTEILTELLKRAGDRHLAGRKRALWGEARAAVWQIRDPYVRMFQLEQLAGLGRRLRLRGHRALLWEAVEAARAISDNAYFAYYEEPGDERVAARLRVAEALAERDEQATAWTLLLEALQIGAELDDSEEAGCNLTGSGRLLELVVLRPGRLSELIARVKGLAPTRKVDPLLEGLAEACVLSAQPDVSPRRRSRWLRAALTLIEAIEDEEVQEGLLDFVGMASVELGHARLVRQVAARMRERGEEAKADCFRLQASLLEGRIERVEERLAALSEAEQNGLLPLVVDGLRRRGRYGRAHELALRVPDPCSRFSALLLLVRTIAEITSFWDGTLAALLVS